MDNENRRRFLTDNWQFLGNFRTSGILLKLPWQSTKNLVCKFPFSIKLPSLHHLYLLLVVPFFLHRHFCLLALLYADLLLFQMLIRSNENLCSSRWLFNKQHLRKRIHLRSWLYFTNFHNSSYNTKHGLETHPNRTSIFTIWPFTSAGMSTAGAAMTFGKLNLEPN